jgi:hypothetical protein
MPAAVVKCEEQLKRREYRRIFGPDSTLLAGPLSALINSFQSSLSVAVQKKVDRLPPVMVREHFALTEGLR